MPHAFDVCLCADDYAMTPGVSRGIREAIDAGALTATSAMTTSPWWAEEARRLEPYAGRASIGLHLNLTLGEPLGAMPTFAPRGRLPDLGTVLRMSRTGRMPADEIAAEIDRQLARFAQVMGRPPDHVDGHQHVHVLGPIRPLLLAALHRHRVTGWIRDSGDRPIRILRRGRDLGKAIGLSVLSHGLRAQAETAGHATNAGFAGFSSFDKGDYGAAFRRYLVAPGRRHLVMCHPGHIDDALLALDPVVESRERELAFFLSPAFREICRAARATPVARWESQPALACSSST